MNLTDNSCPSRRTELTHEKKRELFRNGPASLPGCVPLRPWLGAAMHRFSRPSTFCEAPVNVEIVVHGAEQGGCWGEVLALPRCVSQGEAMDELLANMREAIQAWLDRRSRP